MVPEEGRLLQRDLREEPERLGAREPTHGSRRPGHEPVPGGHATYFDDFGVYEVQNANAFVREKSSSAPGYADVSTGLHGAEYLAGKVESFLTDRDSSPAADAQPWFLYLGPAEPHERAYPIEGNANESSERWGPKACRR